jgi:hypothetical protein
VSLFFDGVSSVNMGPGHPYGQNVGGCTLMAWARLETPTANKSVVGFRGGGSQTRAKLNVDTDLQVSLRAVALDADTSSVFTSGTTIVPFARTHIAGVVKFSSKAGLIYINGQAVAAGVFTNMTAGNSSNTAASLAAFGSGEIGTNNRWLGELEDVRVYNRILTSEEILTIYTGLGKDGNVQDLMGRWPCNDLGDGVAPTIVGDIGPFGFGGLPVNGGGLVYRGGITVSRKRPRPSTGRR